MTSAAIRNATREEWRQHHRRRWIAEGFRLGRNSAAEATVQLATAIDEQERTVAAARAGKAPSEVVQQLHRAANHIMELSYQEETSQ